MFKRNIGWVKVLGLVAVVGLVLAGCGQKSSSSKSADKSPLIVATSGTLYPTSYHDPKTKKLTGFDVQIVRAVGKKLGRKVEFKQLNVDGQLTAVKTGKADMAANDFGISPARKKEFTLSTPYKHSFNSIIVRKKDDSGIHSWADIKGKKAAGEAGTNYQRLAKQLGATTVNYNNVSNDVYFRDVKNGRTDLIMNDYYLQKLALKAMPNSGLKIMNNMYFTTNDDGSGVGILMKKGNTKLVKQVNKALAELKKDGTLKKISEKFYGANVTKEPKVHISKHFTIKN
ncbi:amino acid ABC transporter substrate-binding protein [Secundilactobacillus paracollinoides]|uniref:Amino acid ABC transporter substrate-binding protein n=1 Tax=Secundilactobacillus paracollinoides TaxID=240427 RepID=A0A1B2IYP8_9LACO|nr:transporter substrate-binding domain-containing protein [Secundilactobacillus paracollinoides]ANZ61249.1 amino acid ABC transporter substrate-binding protein [Secundilactobacillus paracollinoides]ANZ64357.1 amino acid ABC transporter substrate-binding protein [Secundilactobacillus paracollinoides]ANZ67171.1 amino acid ABC transporter substrate-binding protein [Secundilactobacillus paracollinoides]KRL76172.1 ABC transporter periplasmic protein [Secundilactobacillus paracollinoides DSM 15502 =